MIAMPVNQPREERKRGRHSARRREREREREAEAEAEGEGERERVLFLLARSTMATIEWTSNIRGEQEGERIRDKMKKKEKEETGSLLLLRLLYVSLCNPYITICKII